MSKYSMATTQSVAVEVFKLLMAVQVDFDVVHTATGRPIISVDGRKAELLARAVEMATDRIDRSARR